MVLCVGWTFSVIFVCMLRCEVLLVQLWAWARSRENFAFAVRGNFGFSWVFFWVLIGEGVH